MLISELQIQINTKLSSIEQQALEIPQEHGLEHVLPIIDAYAGIFNDLFGGDESENYIAHLRTQTDKSNIDFYLATLNALRQTIENSALSDKIKGLLLSKIHDHCDSKLLVQFQRNTLGENGYQQVITGIQPKNMERTVLVKTWGTKREVSNGLKNIVQQQLQGEGVGHASVTMWLNADERGQELIKKYCMSEDGSIKIPHSIKQYANQTVYEIYWSYWPGGLQDLENDIETEQGKVEHNDDVDTLRTMPLELKSRYLVQRYAKDIRLPLIGSFDDSKETPIFQSNVSGSRVMGLSPAATVDVSTIEPDLYRRNYLDLKVKQHKLNEEISALTILKKNYLDEDGSFNESQIEDIQVIKKSSNFLMLLKRFHYQLSEKQVVAQILLSHVISPEQSALLLKDVEKLIAQKKNQSDTLNQKIIEAADLIQENHYEVKKLKHEISELQDAVTTYRMSVGYGKKAVLILDKVKTSGDIYTLTDVEINDLKNCHGMFTDKEYAQLIEKIISNGFISIGDAKKLTPEFVRYDSVMLENLNKEGRKLAKKTSELIRLYAIKKSEKLLFHEKSLTDLDASLLQNQQEVEQFKSVSEEVLSRIKYSEQINSLNQALEELDAYILTNIESVGNSKKDKSKTKNKTKTMPKSIDISYITSNGVGTHTVKNFNDAIKLKNIISGCVKELNAILYVKIKSNEKNQNSKKKVVYQGKHFSYMNAAGETQNRTISTVTQLAAVEKELTACSKHLIKRKSEYLSELIKIKIGINVCAEELADKKIRQGSSNDAVLLDFDVEKMLEKASEIISASSDFHLGTENCSTTCLKILNAGAPEEKKSMFEWHDIRPGDTVASNAFLSNPQSVYSAAKIVERADNGDVRAQKIVDKKRKSSPNRSYNIVLNQVASNMTTYNNVTINLPGLNFTNESENKTEFSWRFYLRFIPHLISLYQDFFQVEKISEETPVESMQAKIAHEIKALNDQKYYLIDSPNASLAIHKMYVALQQNHTNVPFFETDTLALVEHYILSIEAKQTPTEEEKTVLEHYKAIEKERNARIQCVESALIAGSETKAALEARDVPMDNLIWSMNDQDISDALVKNFISKYQEIRSKNKLSFLTSNFIAKLDVIDDVEEKLQLIKKQIRKYPDSRSFKAINECLAADNILEKALRKNSLNSQIKSGMRYTFHYIKLEDEQEAQETHLELPENDLTDELTLLP